ncbi:hypothetical protein Vretimale_16708 [Volvox reticuliferus]|uniref:Glycosyltransferase n=1 Tax=Volvox reticuliferus TaxID=1737510 RepID=A0A8J4CBD1_9CHLO|nr:hypothetical protein Vretifemale_8542 [Volvox reticuliferus]GIM13639.1 hypothetical protein Vretimale_16708 [Volvox reticuliferus]
MLRSLATALVLSVLVAQCIESKSGNHVAMMIQSHFLQHGVRLPTRAFKEAVKNAAINVSHLSHRPSSLVILAMANEEALLRTVPIFLRSLRGVNVSSGTDAGKTFDGRLVMVAWSRDALVMCRELQAEYSHHCVRDAEHAAGKNSLGFHTDGFNALGFAKIKYILNGLSAGHDVMFLDADIIMLRDPLPYFYDHGADIYAMMEKCLLFNDTVSIAAFEYVRHQKLTPPLNIGALFFKATPGVTRCVYNWIWDMYGQVAFRPHVWDQDIFGVLMPKCSYKFDLRLQVLDPRLFQSACYPRCGCMYHDANVTSATLGMSAAGVPPVTGHLCDPGLWGSWLLRHFPCSGTTDQKAWHMRQFAEGLVHGQPVHITKHWAIEKKQGKGDLEGQEEVAEDDAGMSSAENVRL